jgi:hypothetical protein
MYEDAETGVNCPETSLQAIPKECHPIPIVCGQSVQGEHANGHVDVAQTMAHAGDGGGVYNVERD